MDKETDSIDIRVTQCFRAEIKRVDFTSKKVVAASWNEQEFDLRYNQSHCLDQLTFSVRFDVGTDSYVAIRNLTIVLNATTASGDRSSSIFPYRKSDGHNWLVDQPGTLHWSDGKAPQNVGYYRASRTDPLKIELHDVDEGTDAVFEFKYWISGGDASLDIRSGTDSLVTVGETVSVGELQIFSGTFKSSDLLLQNFSSQIHFIPNFSTNETVIAITDMIVNFTDIQSPETNLSNFLISSTKNDFSFWKSVRVPEEYADFSHKNELTIRGPKNAVISLFSDWIQTTPTNLSLRILLDANQNVTLKVKIVEEKMNGDWEVKDYGEHIVDNETMKEIIIPGVRENILRRIRIDFVSNGSLFRVKDISFGDECTPNPCNEKDTEADCEQTGGGEKVCKCSASGKFRGELCKDEDFCKPNSEDGTNYCEQKGAVGEICIPHATKDSIHPFDCVCNSTTDYWDTKNERCTLFGDCKRVISCEVGYKCVEPVLDVSNPCSNCSEDYISVNETCQPKDICDENCGKHQLCVKTESKGMRPTAFCYCPSGHKLVDGKCEPLFDSCPEIYAISAKCEHGCDFSPRSDGKVGYNVACRLPPTTTQTPITSTTSPTTKIHTPNPSTTPIYEPSSRRKRDTEDDVCNDSNEVEGFCGKGVTTCNFTSNGISCHCPLGHRQKDIGQGVATEFGCILDQDCESSLSDEGKKEGQICRINERSLKSYWSCEPGMVLNEDGEKCVSQCDLKSNTLLCVEQDKVCQMDSVSGKPKCVCQPGFNEIYIDKHTSECRMAKFSYITTPLEIVIPSFAYVKTRGPLLSNSPASDSSTYNCPVQNESDTKGCFEKMMKAAEFESKSTIILHEKSIKLLEQELIDAMDILFSDTVGYEDANLLSRQVKENDRKYESVQAVLNFDVEQNETKLIGKFVEECQKKISLSNGQYCVVPGGLHFEMATLKESSMKMLDPCSNASPLYCSAGTFCSNWNNGTRGFNCSCSEGHRIVKTSQLGNAVVDHCEDIDECSEGIDDCPKESKCINYRGSFTCECPEGEEWQRDKNICRDVCEGIICSNGGSCNVRDKHFSQCM